MKSHQTLVLVAALLASTAFAQSPATSSGATTMPADIVKGSTASADMAEGEIRKVDTEAKKLTIKHGEIKNLDMPSMTMVFQVKDPAMLDNIKTGDKIRFKAEKSGGAIVVTDIQPVK